MASSDIMPQSSDPEWKVKEFPPELAWVTDQDRHNFVLTMEVDTNKRVHTLAMISRLCNP